MAGLRYWAVAWQLVAATAQLQVGGAGWALLFDGINDHVQLTGVADTATATVEMWLQPMTIVDGLGQTKVLYNPNGNLIDWRITEAGTDYFFIMYNGGKMNYRSTGQFDNAKLTGMGSLNVDPTSSKGVMYHLAYVRNTTHTLVYFNGELGATFLMSADNGQPPTQMMPILLGARYQYAGGNWFTWDRCFGGIIDEVRWWSVARTQADIKRYRYEPVPANSTGLMQQWRWDTVQATDLATFSLGTGDAEKAPQWIPSPMPQTGGPVAVSTRVGAPPSSFQICALYAPNTPGTNFSATFTGMPTLGTLSGTTVALTKNMTGNRWCGSLTYTSTAPGKEDVPFTVTATLPDGTQLSATQVLSTLSAANRFPIAGSAMCARTDGITGYGSLGSFDFPDPDVWSIGMFVAPKSVLDGTEMFSKHLASGTNQLTFEHKQNGYGLFLWCQAGCPSGVDNDNVVFPMEADDQLVLNTGKTAAQIKAETINPKHVLLTFRCLFRGNSTMKSIGRATLYINGVMIGQKNNLRACLGDFRQAKQDLTVFPPKGSWQTPWEIADEYDGGYVGQHQPGIAAIPSQWLAADFDRVVFWGKELSQADAVVAAAGGLPQEQDIVAQYDFDEDDPTECAARQLWDKTLQCHNLNEAKGRIHPTTAYPWTNSLVGGGLHALSPFSQVPGGVVHATMADNTCVNATLKGSDPDGDKLIYKLAGNTDGVVLFGGLLQYCANGMGRADVSFQYDACDVYGACSSSVSGLGNITFHVLPAGPNIVDFQALEEFGVMRVVFDMATNHPLLDSETAIRNLFTFNASVRVVLGTWEAGNKAVRLSLADGGWPPPPLNVMMNQVGQLRDAAQTSYPSTSRSSAMVSVTCPTGQVLPPSERECAVCKSNSVPTTQGGLKVCVPCDAGLVAAGLICDRCPVGTYRRLKDPACTPCPEGFTTLFQAATGPEQCVCAEGTYREVGATGCTACPLGMTCPAGSEMANFYAARAANGSGTCGLQQWDDAGCPAYPVLKASYWSDMDDPLSVFRCKTALRCPGGFPGNCKAFGTSAELHDRSCSKCHKGWRWDGKDCIQCTETSKSGGTIPIGLIVMVVLIVAYYVSGEGVAVNYWSSPWALSGAIAILACQHYQMTSYVGTANLQFPDREQADMEFWTFIEKPIAILQPECQGLQGFSVTLYYQSAAPMVLMGLTGVVWACSHVVGRVVRPSWRMENNRTLNSMFSILFSFFPAIASLSMVTFKCHTNPNGKTTLLADESILCSGNPWVGMLVVSLIATFVYIIGFGALFSWAVVQAPGHYVDPKFRMRWKFLLVKYHEEVWWWSGPFLAKTVLMNVGFVIFDSGVAQVLWLMGIAGTYLLGTVIFAPWRHRWVNIYDAVVNVCYLFFCALMLWVAGAWKAPEQDQTIVRQVGDTGIGVNVVVTFLMVALIGLTFFEHYAEKRRPHTVEKWVASYHQASKVLGNATLEHVTTFVQEIGNVDRDVLRAALRVLQTEWLGEQLKGRCGSRSESRLGFEGAQKGSVDEPPKKLPPKYTGLASITV